MRPSEIKILQEQHRGRILPVVPMILVGMGTCGIGNGADAVYARIMRQISEDGIECNLNRQMFGSVPRSRW